MLNNWIQVVKKPKREVKGRGEAHSGNKRGGRGNRASYASIVIGKATGLHIRASKREANIFVSRLDPSVTCDELADHLHSVLQLQPNVERVKATLTYASFRLTCKCRPGCVSGCYYMARRVVGTMVARATDHADLLATFSRDAATSAGTNAAIVATVDNDDTVIA